MSDSPPKKTWSPARLAAEARRRVEHLERTTVGWDDLVSELRCRVHVSEAIRRWQQMHPTAKPPKPHTVAKYVKDRPECWFLVRLTLGQLGKLPTKLVLQDQIESLLAELKAMNEGHAEMVKQLGSAAVQKIWVDTHDQLRRAIVDYEKCFGSNSTWARGDAHLGNKNGVGWPAKMAEKAEAARQRLEVLQEMRESMKGVVRTESRVQTGPA